MGAAPAGGGKGRAAGLALIHDAATLGDPVPAHPPVVLLWAVPDYGRGSFELDSLEQARDGSRRRASRFLPASSSQIDSGTFKARGAVQINWERCADHRSGARQIADAGRPTEGSEINQDGGTHFQATGIDHQPTECRAAEEFPARAGFFVQGGRIRIRHEPRNSPDERDRCRSCWRQFRTRPRRPSDCEVRPTESTTGRRSSKRLSEAVRLGASRNAPDR